MKKKDLFILLLSGVLLAGCTAASPSATTAATSAATTAAVETVSPTTLPPETEAPTTEPVDPIQELLDSMTVEERVGQLFLARCNNTTALEDITAYHLGGFVLYARDFADQDTDTMPQILASYQAASQIPMLLAVDEEGGTVTRISRYTAFREMAFPSPRDAYNYWGMDGVLLVEEEKCQLLSSLGVNVNLAPVCDMADDPSAFLYDRSIGLDAEGTGEFVTSTVQIMAEYSIGSVLKHFPGYGNNADTHSGTAVDSRSLEEFIERDFIPFQMGIDAGADCVLVSHTIVQALDAEVPASLSAAVHTYLRQEMGFTGVILTDDLAMQAITDLYDTGEAAVLAVLAGNDLLCSTDYAEQFQAVLQAVQAGRIGTDTLDAAVYRVLQWKVGLGLIQF